jgi:glycosyltransferase involved in cell wall biosynthesis
LIEALMESKISIITVCFNCEGLIERTIKSVIDQTYTNVQYIIIDGGSTDDTLNVIKRYEDSIDVLLSESDNGIYDAMNKGLNYATGDLVYFLNAGDYLCNNDVLRNVIEKL